MNEVTKLYTDKCMPITAIAKLLGRNVLDVWRGFVLSETFKIAVCLGSQQERDDAVSLVEHADKGLMLEPLSLYSLHVLFIHLCYGSQSLSDRERKGLDCFRGVQNVGIST